MIVSEKMTGGQMTNNGEFYLRMPEDIYLFYNFKDKQYTLGDGQSLDFQQATGKDKSADILFALIKDGDCYCDVGANNGYYYSLRVAKALPKTKVIAFEPNPMIQYHLSKNISFNGLENVTIVHEALCDKVGTAGFAYEFGAGSYLTASQGETLKTMSVKTNTLDQYALSNLEKNVDFIKVDIEGGEYSFLKGAEETLRKSSPILVLELRENLLRRSLATMNDVVEFMKNLGYHFYAITGTADVLCIPENKKDAIKSLDPSSIEVLP